MKTNIEHIKSYKRAKRRELFEKFYRNRIKYQMNAYGFNQMLHPNYESFAYRWVDPLNYLDRRTKDWRKIRNESTWFHKYKDVHSKYKKDEWYMWNKKLKKHLDRAHKNEAINEGIEEYYEDI